MAALITGRIGDVWITITRRWTIIAWYFLSLGLLIGGWWSYHVLGWGGYWAWDPVENAAFMPWLTGTAFLHSVMIQERRRMLQLWNLALIILTFSLTLFGTFLDALGRHRLGARLQPGRRSASSSSAFLTLVVLSALARSWPGAGTTCAAQGELDSIVSRESAFLLNNVLAGRGRLHRLLRHRLPAPVGGGAGRQGERRRAVLQPGQHPALPRR